MAHHITVPQFVQLAVDVHQEADRLVIGMEGELDVATVQRAFDVAIAALQASPDGRVDVDLSDVAFCDSTGMQMLLDLRQNASRRGGEVRLTNVSARVRRVFEIVGVTEALADPADDPFIVEHSHIEMTHERLAGKW
jgi:anti-anti-sigma factor